jgi:hypothetical protein
LRNPAPVDRWFIPLFIVFQPSKVVQDFFHPQYHYWVSPNNGLIYESKLSFYMAKNYLGLLYWLSTRKIIPLVGSKKWINIPLQGGAP